MGWSMTNPYDVFPDYSADPVPQDQWPAFLEHVSQEVLASWSRTAVEDAALGRPVPIASGQPSEAQLARMRRALRLLRGDPVVQGEQQRLRVFLADSAVELGVEQPALDIQLRRLIWDEAAGFSERYRVATDVPAHDVMTYLWWTTLFPHIADYPDEPLSVFRDSLWPLVLHAARPMAWANISRHQVEFAMPPGCILVDVTHSSAADLRDIWKAIKNAQDQLRRARPKGGRPSEEQVRERVEELLAAGIKWKDIPDRINAEFPPTDPDYPRTLDSLKRLQTSWRAKKRRINPEGSRARRRVGLIESSQ